MPGLVSTLLTHMYSAPLRLVQTFLQGMLQVWQPMHLSRFNTIASWALIFIPLDLPGLAHHDHLVALGADGAVVVEAVAELGVAPDHVGGLDHDARDAVVGAAALAGKRRARRVDEPLLRVVHEGLARRD